MTARKQLKSRLVGVGQSLAQAIDDTIDEAVGEAVADMLEPYIERLAAIEDAVRRTTSSTHGKTTK